MIAYSFHNGRSSAQGKSEKIAKSCKIIPF